MLPSNDMLLDDVDWLGYKRSLVVTVEVLILEVSDIVYIVAILVVLTLHLGPYFSLKLLLRSFLSHHPVFLHLILLFSHFLPPL